MDPRWSLKHAMPSRKPRSKDSRPFGALNRSYRPMGHHKNSAGEKKPPVIIALQGEPYSGKTKLANNLVEWLKCPVVRLEEILEILSPNTEPSPTPDRAEAVVSQAFDIITQIVKTHTSMGFSVILDSPLSRRSHLDKLVGLLTDSQEKKRPLSLLIIECKPKLQYTSQMKFDERHPSSFNKWYKPQDWPPEAKFTGRDYTDDDIHPLVSKLTFDPRSSFVISNFVEALHSLIAAHKGYKIEFTEWKSSEKPTTNNDTDKLFIPMIAPEIGQHEHSISCYLTGGDAIIFSTTCGICKDDINNSSSSTEIDDGAFVCQDCPLFIHKKCAMLEVTGDSSQERYLTPKTFPKFYEREPEATFFFPEEDLCRYCREAGREFSYNCPSCVFECHLKCRLLPTIVKHDELPSGAFFYVKSLSSHNLGNCSACRRQMGNVGYLSTNTTGNCNLTYHPECLFLPPFIRGHEHGGHEHDLEMIFRRDKELENYLCDLCSNTLHPASWYYCCKYCYLELHLDCAFEEFT